MRKSGIFLPVLVLSLLPCLPCWSDSLQEENQQEMIQLTPEEWEVLVSNELTLKQTSEKKTMYIESLEMSLNESKKEGRKKMLTVGAVSFSAGFALGSLLVLIFQ